MQKKISLVADYKSKEMFRSLPYIFSNPHTATEQINEFQEFVKKQILSLMEIPAAAFEWRNFQTLCSLYEALIVVSKGLEFTYDFTKEEILKELNEGIWSSIDEIVYNNTRLRNCLIKLKNKTSSETRVHILKKWIEQSMAPPFRANQIESLKIEEKISTLASEISNNITKAMKDATQCYVVSKAQSEKLKGASQTLLTEANALALDLGLPECYVFAPYQTDKLLKELKISETRKEVYKKYIESNTKKKKFNNSRLLTDLIKNKQKLAKLKKKDNYYELVTKNYLFKDKKNIEYFLKNTIKTMEPFYNKNIEELKGLAQADGLKKLNVWDVPYFKTTLSKLKFEVLEQHYNINLERAQREIFKLLTQQFNIEITRVKDPELEKISNSRVETYLLKDNATHRESYLILDILNDFDRKESGYYICQELRSHSSHAKAKTRGIYCIRGNFAKTKGIQTKTQVVTALLHELGHVMHGFYSQHSHSVISSMSEYSWDLIELPSKFLEQFMYDPSFMARIIQPKKKQSKWKTESDVQSLIESNLWLDNFFNTYENLHIDLKKLEIFTSFKPHSNKIVSEVMTGALRNKVYFNPNTDYFLCDENYKCDYGPTKYVYLLNDIMAHYLFKTLHSQQQVPLNLIYKNIFSQDSNLKVHQKLKSLIDFSQLDINNYLCRDLKFDFFTPIEQNSLNFV